MKLKSTNIFISKPKKKERERENFQEKKKASFPSKLAVPWCGRVGKSFWCETNDLFIIKIPLFQSRFFPPPPDFSCSTMDGNMLFMGSSNRLLKLIKILMNLRLKCILFVVMEICVQHLASDANPAAHVAIIIRNFCGSRFPVQWHPTRTLFLPGN